MTALDLQQWLRSQCHAYVYDLRGVFRVAGSTSWPLTATDAADLESQLEGHGHLLPLPKEPAALANVLEVSIVDFLLDRVAATGGSLVATRGGERTYPDLEITGPGVGGAFHAVDIKVAQRKLNRDTTSRVDDLELIVHQPWRIGSRRRSSTTREYIGAFLGLEDLRQGQGEFQTEAEFYLFWRAYNFRIGASVRHQLNKLLAQNQGPA